MSSNEHIIGIGLAFLVVGISLPFYYEASLWVGVGIFLGIYTIFNAAVATRQGIPYPQVTIAIALIQLVLATWGNWLLPYGNPEFNIGSAIGFYLSYAVPACVALFVGCLLPFMFFPTNPSLSRFILKKKEQFQLKKDLDSLIIIGIIFQLLLGFFPGSFHFVAVLGGNLAFVGLFGFVLYNLQGWKVRSGVVWAICIVLSLRTGLFHALILWMMFFVFVVAYRRRWRCMWMFSVMITGLVAIIMLQAIKLEFREKFWATSHGIPTRVIYFSKLLYRTATNPLKVLREDNLSYTMVRMNQGSIVYKVMIWTPDYTPFARGKTIKRAIASCVTPRFLNPEKFRVGGSENFERFTGHHLLSGTSMDLGFAGEMYANFGRVGGIIAVGIYGFFLGCGYFWFHRRAAKAPMWWAWATYVAVIAVKAETSIGQVLNWMVKATFVMILVIGVFPTMRNILFPKRRQ